MDFLRQDLRYALRRLRQSPGFTFVAVTIMGLGIGANTAIFSIVNAVLFRAKPYANPQELVRVFTTEDDGRSPSAVSYPDFLDYRDRDDLFVGAAATNVAILSLVSDEGSQAAFAEYGSWNFFPLVGLEPSLGRTFRPEEDEPGLAEPVVMLSHDVWQRRFDGDPGVLGSTIRLNGRSVTVVGVGPEGYSGTMTGITSDYWLPWGSAVAVEPGQAGQIERRGTRSLFVYARMRPGVTAQQVESALSVLATQLGDAYPDTNEGRAVAVFPANDVRLHPIIDNALFPVAGMLMAVVGLVLLVACTNLANLLLVRASSRRKEVAIRLALGARRGRLISQLLTESTMLGVMGGGVGLLVAYWAARFIVSFQPPIPFPVTIDLSLDGTVLGFTMVLSILTGVVFGLAPSLRASRPDLVPTLKDENVGMDIGHNRFGMRNILVVSQVAISLVLLIGAGLFVRSLGRAQHVDPGFETTNAAIATIDVSVGGYDETTGPLFFDRFMQRLATHPGVESVALADRVPLGVAIQTVGVFIDGYALPADQDELEIDYAVVSPDYFDTMGVPVIRGRSFTAFDTETSPPVAIVSAAMARRFWGTEDVVGEQVRRSTDGPTIEVVGVARDTKVRTLGESPRPYLYRPFSQDYSRFMSIIVRTTDDPGAIPEAVRRELAAMSPEIPLFESKTMSEHLGIMLFAPRMGAVLLAGFAVLAVILASIGLYGVVAFSVGQRTREIGLRVALGARPGQVVGMVVREGMRLVVVGLMVGLALGSFATRPLSGMLIDVPAFDPATFAVVSIVLAGVTLLASYVPARRAADVDPMVALRYE